MYVLVTKSYLVINSRELGIFIIKIIMPLLFASLMGTWLPF